MIDAAGAIYVIGGFISRLIDAHLQDVWVSTDRGARPDSVWGYSRGVHWVVLRGLLRGALEGTMGVLRG